MAVAAEADLLVGAYLVTDLHLDPVVLVIHKHEA